VLQPLSFTRHDYEKHHIRRGVRRIPVRRHDRTGRPSRLLRSRSGTLLRAGTGPVLHTGSVLRVRTGVLSRTAG